MTDETVVAPAATSEPAADTTTAPVEKQEQKAPEPKSDAAVDGSDTAADEDEGDTGKRPSRSQRQGRKLALFAAENAELRRMVEEGRRPSDDRQAKPAADDVKPPKEADFGGDYLAFERALNAYNTEKAVNDAVRKQVAEARDSERRQRQAEARQEAVVAHMERVDEAKERIADFDQVLKSSGQVQLALQVADELLDSDKSALLQYYLAKNPDKLKELNGMSGRELAREIGRLEGRVHLPKAKTATEAGPPLSDVRGGAAPAVNLENADMSSFVRMRREQEKRRET